VIESNQLSSSVATNIRLLVCLFAAFAPFVSRATTYYISQKGDDAHNGTSIEHAWKSLEHVNKHAFQPGDQLLFKSGSRFTGQLRPQGSGKVEGDKIVPIVIGNMVKDRNRASMAKERF